MVTCCTRKELWGYSEYTETFPTEKSRGACQIIFREGYKYLNFREPQSSLQSKHRISDLADVLLLNSDNTLLQARSLVILLCSIIFTSIEFRAWYWILIAKVGIDAGYQLDGRGWIPGKGKYVYFLYSRASRTALGPTESLNQQKRGRTGRDADHSPSSNVEINSSGNILLLSLLVW